MLAIDLVKRCTSHRSASTHPPPNRPSLSIACRPAAFPRAASPP